MFFDKTSIESRALQGPVVILHVYNDVSFGCWQENVIFYEGYDSLLAYVSIINYTTISDQN